MTKKPQKRTRLSEKICLDQDDGSELATAVLEAPRGHEGCAGILS
jgi:hypothetical protein